MSVPSVVRLTTDDLAEIKGTDRPVVGDVTYIYLSEHKGIKTYRGSDRTTVMGIVEEGCEALRVIVTTRVAERWLFNSRDEGRASRHVTVIVRRAAGIATT